MKNVVLDKVIEILRLKRFNNKSRSIVKYGSMPSSLKEKLKKNNQQLQFDKRFLFNLILIIAQNKGE